MHHWSHLEPFRRGQEKHKSSDQPTVSCCPILKDVGKAGKQKGTIATEHQK